MELCDIYHEDKQNVLVIFCRWPSRFNATVKISGKYLLCLHLVEMM